MGRCERGRVGAGDRSGRAAVGRLALPFALALALGIAGCTALDNFLASIPIFSFMRSSPSLDPYEMPRPAPPGAVPFESPGGELLPPLAPTDAALTAFGETVRKPTQPTDVVLAAGREMYDRQCAVCHGATGRGDGTLIGAGRFPYAPDLTLPITVQRTDGYLYGIVRVGRGLMPAYAERISHVERWYVVEYMRQLQAAAGQAPAAASSPAEE